MTEAAQLKIVSESDNYMENETPVCELLFKLMMQKSAIDTRATYTYLRENLTNSDAYISKVNLDIEDFNHYMKVNVDELISRGIERMTK